MSAKKSVAARFPLLPTRLLGISRHNLRKYVSAFSDKKVIDPFILLNLHHLGRQRDASTDIHEHDHLPTEEEDLDGDQATGALLFDPAFQAKATSPFELLGGLR
jgi:hypothetical protein